jgi:hypothetical protein
MDIIDCLWEEHERLRELGRRARPVFDNPVDEHVSVVGEVKRRLSAKDEI